MKSDNKIEPHLKHFVDYNFKLTLNRWWFDLSHNRLLQPDIPHFAKSNSLLSQHDHVFVWVPGFSRKY